MSINAPLMRPAVASLQIKNKDNTNRGKIEYLIFAESEMTTNIADQVLVVDDSRAVRNIVQKILTQLGYIEVDEASDGAAAFAKMNVKHYALVISDWNMEPINGKALLVQVRSTKKMENIPFIMMTTGSDQYKILKARFAPLCFIDKPFSAEALQSKISEINTK